MTKTKNSTFSIEKKTPRTDWHPFHTNLDLELAKYMLAEIGRNYDADDTKAYDSELFDGGVYLQVFEGGDLHEFRIVGDE